jgi:hypothetical protein
MYMWPVIDAEVRVEKRPDFRTVTNCYVPEEEMMQECGSTIYAESKLEPPAKWRTVDICRIRVVTFRHFP